MGESVVFFSVIIGFFWLMGVLFTDFGPIVIVLFFSGIGNLVLAGMTLIDIKRTWRPLLFISGGVFAGYYWPF